MEILIFTHNSRIDGTHWMIVARGAIFYVKSWVCSTPVESRQLIDDMITHPLYGDGKTPLPRFYLRTRGEIDILNGQAVIKAALPQPGLRIQLLGQQTRYQSAR